LFAIFTYAKYQPFNVDAGYYLNVSRLISLGQYPNIHFYELYMPLFFWITSIFFNSNGEILPYIPFLLIQFFSFLASVFLVLSYVNTKNKNFIFISILIVYLSIMILDGSGIYLEQPTLFWFSVAYFFVRKTQLNIKYFFSGFFLSLAFLTKQYALLYFVAMVCYVNITRIKIYETFLLTLGFLTPLLLFLGAYIFVFKANLPEVVSFVWNNRYGRREVYWLFRNLFVMTKQNLLIIILFVVSVVLLFKKNKQLEIEILKPLLFPFCIALMYYFPPGHYLHYAILIIPIIIAWILDQVKDYGKGLKLGFLLSLFVFINPQIRNVIYGMNKNSRNEQIQLAKKISQEIGTSKKVLILDAYLEPYRFLAKLELPMPKAYGNMFCMNLSADELNNMKENADYILASEDAFKNSPEKFSGFTLIRQFDKVWLWEKKSGL
jgi:hypothetical protein